jgi:hypothetical protein
MLGIVKSSPVQSLKSTPYRNINFWSSSYGLNQEIRGRHFRSWFFGCKPDHLCILIQAKKQRDPKPPMDFMGLVCTVSGR